MSRATHWEPSLDTMRPATPLVAPALGPLPARDRRGMALLSTLLSLLLHALPLILILLGLLPAWLFRDEHKPERPLEVSLVVVPPPAPPAPPPKPEPPPKLPLSSDAQSEGPGKPAPADKGEAAPAAPAPGPPATVEKKPEAPPAPKPTPKPAAAPEHHPPTPPVPRSTLHATAPAPPQAAPTRSPEQETQTAMSVPAPDIAPAPRGEQPAIPDSGKKARKGFAVHGEAVPAGRQAALYNAYLAMVRDKIAEQRALLKPYKLSGGSGVAVGLALDRAGRLMDAGIILSSGSRALDHTASMMVTLAAPFMPPPPELAGERIFLRFDLMLPTSEADWDEMLGG